MQLRNKIYARGLKISWIAKQLDINYNSLRVYLMDESKMPIEVEDKLRKFLT